MKKYRKLFLKAAEKSIQFVPGMEAYFQPEKVEGNRDSFHLILYAKVNGTVRKQADYRV